MFICLGLGGALHHVAVGYGQLLPGALSPLHVGARLVAILADVFQHDSYRSGLGILAAKFLAFNSLPLGTLSGGFLVGCLLEIVGLRSDILTVRSHQWLGYFVVLLLLVAWTIAFLGALLNVW